MMNTWGLVSSGSSCRLAFRMSTPFLKAICSNKATFSLVFRAVSALLLINVRWTLNTGSYGEKNRWSAKYLKSMKYTTLFLNQKNNLQGATPADSEGIIKCYYYKRLFFDINSDFLGQGWHAKWMSVFVTLTLKKSLQKLRVARCRGCLKIVANQSVEEFKVS